MTIRAVGAGAGGTVGDPASVVHRLDPRAKLVGLTGLTVVAVTTPLSAWPVYAACGIALAGVAFTARLPPGIVVRRVLVVVPAVALSAALLPFVRPGVEVWSAGGLTVTREGLSAFGAVAVKALIGTLSAVTLGATTSLPQILRGLESLRVPSLITLIAALMHRYLFVLLAELRQTRSAMTARGYRPRHVLHAAALGSVMATLFFRAHARAERVHRAMLARGFTTTMPARAPLQATWRDVAFVSLVAIAVVPLRVLGSVA